MRSNKNESKPGEDDGEHEEDEVTANQQNHGGFCKSRARLVMMASPTENPDKKRSRLNRKMRKAAEKKGKWHNRRDLPPEELGSWDIKKQRQGEADNPGPERNEVDSDDDEMPALVQEEDSDLETGFRGDEDESEDETNEHQGRKKQNGEEKGNGEIAKQQTHGGSCESRARLGELTKIEEGPKYQPKQNEVQHPFYTPGSKRGNKNTRKNDPDI